MRKTNIIVQPGVPEGCHHTHQISISVTKCGKRHKKEMINFTKICNTVSFEIWPTNTKRGSLPKCQKKTSKAHAFSGASGVGKRIGAGKWPHENWVPCPRAPLRLTLSISDVLHRQNQWVTTTDKRDRHVVHSDHRYRSTSFRTFLARTVVGTASS